MGSSKFKSFEELKEIKESLTEEKKEFSSKKEYQKHWVDNKNEFRKMVARKNKRWLDENKSENFIYYKKYDNVYMKIVAMFSKESSRKWLLHIINNFFPLNRSVQVPKLPQSKNKCAITNFAITDLDKIRTGIDKSRDKHIAFTGVETDVIICGVAIQELERFVYSNIDTYKTPDGQIINFALDKLRSKLNDKSVKK